MEPKKTKPLGFWMVLIAVIAAAAILGMILVHGNRHTGGAVQVTQNGETVGLYPGRGPDPPLRQRQRGL